MQIDLKQPISTLAGEPYKTAEGSELTLGNVIAESLATDTTEGKMKLYILAQKAYSEKTMEVDTADLALIKRAIQTNKSYNALILGQAELKLEEIK